MHLPRASLLEAEASVRAQLGRAVREGLSTSPKRLPSWLRYDEAGLALAERVTTSPEHYLARAEAEIFRTHGDSIAWVAGEGSRISLTELNAGAPTKTEALLQAVIARQHACCYLACDPSPAALEKVREKIQARFSSVDLHTAAGGPTDAAALVPGMPDRQVLLLLGSILGTFDDDGAAALLWRLRCSLRDDGALVLGVDRKKDPAALVAAYDDGAGAAAALNKSALLRLNRELRADFDPARFRHVATWNERAASVELWLESTRTQVVRIGALGLEVPFFAGERVRTESHAKYDEPRIDRVLDAAGFARARTFSDRARSYSVHIAYPVTARS